MTLIRVLISSLHCVYQRYFVHEIKSVITEDVTLTAGSFRDLNKFCTVLHLAYTVWDRLVSVFVNRKVSIMFTHVCH